ncbi:unnamed protein product [Euphydryas editha]|nr:unnamed protein product [Euphydryas editha]
MFRENDFLVAQDRLYKDRVPYGSVFAKYGRIFKCPITYFRVVDRLGIGRGPGVEVIRGGLRHKYLVLRLQSPYNKPISVNIYVGCENKTPPRTELRSTTSTVKITTSSTKSTVKTTTTENPSNITTTISSQNT